jgi:predicted ABC-type ATPase
VRIDQPADPAGDLAEEGDALPDEPAPEYPAPVASDTESSEPRTRQEHADHPPPPHEARELPENPTAQANEDESRSEKSDSLGPDAQSGLDTSLASPKESGNQEELPASEEAPSDTDVEDENTQVEDSSGDPPDSPPAQNPNQAWDQESPPDDNPSGPGSGAPYEEPSKPSQDSAPSDDRTNPLTDKEWTEHLTEVRDGLDQARREGLESHLLYTIDPDHQSWSKDRRGLHDSIIHDLYSAAQNIPNQGSAIITGGLGGAGKTTVLTEHAGVDLSQYLIINPDDIKEEMARRAMIPDVQGLSPMDASDLVHQESSHLARQLALRAHADGKNLIWDITMSTEEGTVRRIKELRAAGYTQVDGLLVDIPVETSIKRADARHREGHDQYHKGEGLGGRYVPPEVIKCQEDAEWGSKNRKTFEAVKERFNDWSIYDNSVDGRRAVLVDSSRSRYAG